MQSNTADSRPSLVIPVAIIVGFGLIALSIYLSAGKQSARVTPPEESAVVNLSRMNPITEEDHIRGNPNAKIVIVEYSDFDCPFCKSFHATLQQIIEEYGPSGQVSWVYRHFPLTGLHPSAAHVAEASECVAELGGNDAFWKFSDLAFGERASNEPTNIARLPEFAQISGVKKEDYEACVQSGRHKDKVESDYNNAVATGGRGTPHSILLVGDQMVPINGAQSYETVKQIIEGFLN